jgi:hypothetical protein
MIIIPGQDGTYRHLRSRVTGLLADSGLIAAYSKGVADVWIRGLKTGHWAVSGTDTDPGHTRGKWTFTLTITTG